MGKSRQNIRAENELKKHISKYLGSEQIYFYWKGRVALYAILKSMGVRPGDEIIIPAYTCVVVPNPIIYLGAKPIYVPIERGTYNMDASKIEAAITPRTKAIVAQNTYGLSTNLEEIIEIARRHKLYTIEDCTHGFGGTYNGQPNGTHCDASFFSTQWNKPFSSGLGGFLLVNNKVLLPGIEKLEKEKILPSWRDRIMLKLLFFNRHYLMNDRNYWVMVKFYRWLSQYNLVLGSSAGEEIKSVKKPKDFFKDYSIVQTREAICNIKGLGNMLKIRKENAKIYTRFLKKHGKNHVPRDCFDNHSFLKYPLLVKDRKKFMTEAEKNKIRLGDWFLSPLHPVTGDLSPWQYNEKQFKNSTEISSKIINIPTDERYVNKVMVFLEQNLDMIE